MFKKFRNVFFITVMMLLLFSVTTFADDNKIPVHMNGKTINGYLIEEKTMISLAEFCQNADPKSTVKALSDGTVSIQTRGISVSARDGGYYVEANGRCFYTDVACRYINGTLYVPIRAAARAYDAGVIWNDALRSVEIVDSGKVCASADEIYWDGAVLWLSRIIYAESRGEPLLGKIAVGNVVMIRVDSKLFPNTIYGVIFDKKYGVQFTPVASGAIYNNANAECIRAAKMVLEGTTVNDGVLYFMNPRIATSSWISKNRTFAFSIGNHWFYY